MPLSAEVISGHLVDGLMVPLWDEFVNPENVARLGLQDGHYKSSGLKGEVGNVHLGLLKTSRVERLRLACC